MDEYPTTNGGMQNGSSVGIYCAHCIHGFFCTYGADLYAQSVVSNKIFALDLSRNFIKSALLVGQGEKGLFSNSSRIKSHQQKKHQK